MSSTNSCEYCGRYRGRTKDPHPDSDSCPYEKDHADRNSDKSLLEAIQATCSGNSVCLFGWNASYPAFKTVFKTRSWLETSDTSTEDYEGHEEFNTSYFKKTIWVTDNPHQVDGTHQRIEYDSRSESLIDWYTVTAEAEERKGSPFEIYIRKVDPDVSFFGSTLPD